MDYAIKVLKKKLSEVIKAQDECVDTKNYKDFDTIQNTKAEPLIDAINTLKFINQISRKK